MIASKIGLWIYRSNITAGPIPYKDAYVYPVKDIIGGAQFIAQTIGENIFVLAPIFDDERVLKHEYEHVKQWRRYGTVGFALRYVGEFISHLIRHYINGSQTPRMEAYRDISMEREAREAENS